jgi:hypothetical protein
MARKGLVAENWKMQLALHSSMGLKMARIPLNDGVTWRARL